jgi:hypothetical protein
MKLYTASILECAREALETHGSIRAFLANGDASARAVHMYVADCLSVMLGVDLYLADSDGLGAPRGPMRGVHVTDGVSTIVRCDMRDALAYDDIAPFLCNAVGYKDGKIASAWERVIVARSADATVCNELAALFARGPFQWRFSIAAVELHMLALLDVTRESEPDGPDGPDGPDDGPDDGPVGPGSTDAE